MYHAQSASPDKGALPRVSFAETQVLCVPGINLNGDYPGVRQANWIDKWILEHRNPE